MTHTIEPSQYLNKYVNYKYGLHNHLLSEMSISSDKHVETMHLFSNQVKTKNKASNQKSSGRCWLFAGLNMIRNKFIEDNNLSTDFEFSQNYMLFWDKFERINYFINLYDELRNEELDSQLMQFLLKDPLCDGGQWQMFVNLVDKHGLVPKSVYPETTHSSNTF